MAQEKEIINVALSLLKERGLDGELTETDSQRVVVFVQDLEDGVIAAPQEVNSDQIAAFTKQVEKQYQTQGEPITTMFIAACVLIGIIYGQSRDRRFLQETIESIGNAGRNILDSRAGAELLKVLIEL
jgi:hypothetical protein